MRLILPLLGALASTCAAETLADRVVYYEPGLAPTPGFSDPRAALVHATDPADPAGIVSLGAWSDDPETGSNDGRPTGIVLSWSFPVPDLDGPDLRIRGNSFGGFPEPGTVEVAAETTGLAGSWEDETFYLLRPANYADLAADPRTAPAGFDPQDSNGGYADVTPGGDLFDLSDAIDLAGDPVSLERVTYVRIRTAIDRVVAPFGQVSTEIDTVSALHELVAPLPAPTLESGWTATPVLASPAGWTIEALAVDPADRSLITTETDYRDRTATRILRDGVAVRTITPPVFVSFVTPTTIGYSDASGGGGFEALTGGSFVPVPQIYDSEGLLISHNPVPFGSGPPSNQISAPGSDGSLVPVVTTGGFSGPIATTEPDLLWYAEPSGSLYSFNLGGRTFDGTDALTLADAERTLSRPLNALASGGADALLAHDFATLVSIDTSPGPLPVTTIANTPLFFGSVEMWAGEIYVVVTDYGKPQSAVFRLTPGSTFSPGTIRPTPHGATATLPVGHRGRIETLGPGGTWVPATTTAGATREATTLNATAESSSALFRLHTYR